MLVKLAPYIKSTDFNLPERAVHVVDVDASKLLGQFRWGEEFQLMEQLILRLFVLSIEASRINEQAERPMPQATRDLSISSELSSTT